MSSLTPLQAMEKRRTIRNYDPNYQVEKSDLEKIAHALQISPTAGDFQGMDFIFVTNKDKLSKLNDVVIKAFPEGPLKQHLIDRQLNME